MLTILTSALLWIAVYSNPAVAEIIRVALLPVVVHTSDPESAHVVHSRAACHAAENRDSAKHYTSPLDQYSHVVTFVSD